MKNRTKKSSRKSSVPSLKFDTKDLLRRVEEYGFASVNPVTGTEPKGRFIVKVLGITNAPATELAVTAFIANKWVDLTKTGWVLVVKKNPVTYGRVDIYLKYYTNDAKNAVNTAFNVGATEIYDVALAKTHEIPHYGNNMTYVSVISDKVRFAEKLESSRPIHTGQGNRFVGAK